MHGIIRRHMAGEPAKTLLEDLDLQARGILQDEAAGGLFGNGTTAAKSVLQESREDCDPAARAEPRGPDASAARSRGPRARREPQRAGNGGRGIPPPPASPAVTPTPPSTPRSMNMIHHVPEFDFLSCGDPPARRRAQSRPGQPGGRAGRRRARNSGTGRRRPVSRRARRAGREGRRSASSTPRGPEGWNRPAASPPGVAAGAAR